MQGRRGRVAQAASRADAVFIPDGPDAVPAIVQALTANGDERAVQLLGSGLWDDPRIFAEPSLHGAWYAAPDRAGYRNFARATAHASVRIRCARRRSPMMRSRWSRRW